MTATFSQTRVPGWGKALAHPAQEFPLTPLPILEGQIPQALRGSLYRNGPGRLERGNRSVGHWFDGDGAILAVHFSEDGAIATYRYVQTDGYQTEARAGTLLYGNYGMTAPGPIWNHWLRPLKNSANTSVLALPDQLLALWEGDHPYALDLQTLETLGTTDLSGLQSGWPYSAHPKRDPATGEIFNFGISLGAKPTLQLYRSDRTGRIQQHNAIALSGLPLIHDFVLAGPYLVFLIPPVRISPLPVAIGWKSFSDAMTWKPELGTQILVVDRATLTEVCRNETEPWFQWHFSNGFVDQHGDLVIDLVHYADFQTNQYLKEVATGQTQTPAKGTLRRLRFHLETQTAEPLDMLVDRGCDFPTIAPHQTGQTTRSTYLALHRSDADPSREIFGAIAQYDHSMDRLTVGDCGEGRYPSEPLFLPHSDYPEQGWLSTVVFDSNTETSEVWIYRCDRLEDGPLCRLGLPGVIPPSFHGTWKPA